jgi:hypothetical protein
VRDCELRWVEAADGSTDCCLLFRPVGRSSGRRRFRSSGKLGLCLTLARMVLTPLFLLEDLRRSGAIRSFRSLTRSTHSSDFLC